MKPTTKTAVSRQASDKQATTNKELKKGKSLRAEETGTTTAVFSRTQKRPSSLSKPESVSEVWEYAQDQSETIGASDTDELAAIVRRFIHYNNSRGWPVDNWRYALLAFSGNCANTGASDVPPSWKPEIM